MPVRWKRRPERGSPQVRGLADCHSDRDQTTRTSNNSTEATGFSRGRGNAPVVVLYDFASIENGPSWKKPPLACVHSPFSRGVRERLSGAGLTWKSIPELAPGKSILFRVAPPGIAHHRRVNPQSPVSIESASDMPLAIAENRDRLPDQTTYMHPCIQSGPSLPPLLAISGTAAAIAARARHADRISRERCSRGAAFPTTTSLPRGS